MIIYLYIHVYLYTHVYIYIYTYDTLKKKRTPQESGAPNRLPGSTQQQWYTYICAYIYKHTYIYISMHLYIHVYIYLRKTHKERNVRLKNQMPRVDSQAARSSNGVALVNILKSQQTPKHTPKHTPKLAIGKSNGANF